MTDFATPLRAILAEMDLELYDVELVSSTLNVTVRRAGGVDLETVASASRKISAWLDEKDPIAGRYTLDVSSPGLERKLRTAEHFAVAVGEIVTLRELRVGEPTRRLEGPLVRTDGHKVVIRDNDLGEVEVNIDRVERARTVFVWGATAKPSPSKVSTSTAKTRSK